MADYANRETKELIVCVAACVGFAKTLLEHEFRNKELADPHLLNMHNEAQFALDEICKGLSLEAMDGIMKFAGNSEIICVPKSDPRTNKRMYFVDEPDMFMILDRCLDCQFCVLDQTAVKNCEVRKALVRSGVTPIGGGGCPYKGV